MSALGEEFRSAREARSLSLSDVAERLHIRSVYLAAIEDEEWHVIGASVYVRGFLRTYARFLGLDPEAAVARFTATLPDEGAAAASGRAAASATANEMRGERSGPSLAAVFSIAAAVLVVLFVGYEFYQYRAGTPAAVPLAQSSASPEAAAVPNTVPDAVATPAASPRVAASGPAAPAAAKPGLSLHVTEPSWLRVTVDGVVVLEGTLPAGAAKSFTGKTVDVRIGNAGGVQIAVNGHPLGPLGASGDVVERRFVVSGE